MKVKMSKFVKYLLIYSDFDVEEVKSTLPELFPNAKSVEVTTCEDHWLEVLVDGQYYTVNVTCDVKDGKIYEERL